MQPEFDWNKPDYDAVYQQRIDRIRRIRSGELNLAALKEFYRTHPVEFCTDWGMTFDPRLADQGLPTTIPFVLFKKQAEFIEWCVARWKGREDGICEKSRDMGVTWLCVAFAVWMWLYVDGSVVGFGSRKEEYVDKIGAPKSIFWKLRAFVRLLPSEFRPIGYSEKLHAPYMRMINPENGSSIMGEAGDNIGRGDRTSIYFVDEHAFIENAESVEASLSQTSNCRIYVSTPNGAGNSFYRKRHSGKFSVFVFDWKDDPRKDQAWYEKMKATLDPVVLAQEVDRDYSASVANSYIDGKKVTEATMRGPADVVAVGPLLCGVDVARFGDDKTCITFRKGRLLTEQIEFGKQDIPNVAGRVKDLVKSRPEKVAQIAVDTIGLGAGVADILRRDFGSIVEDINSSNRLDDGKNYNLRAKMWREMGEWIANGASIPRNPELVTDLTALRYLYKSGLLLIESKDDAKKRGIKSPDRADSLALTFATPVKIPDPEPEGVPDAWKVLDEVIGW